MSKNLTYYYLTLIEMEQKKNQIYALTQVFEQKEFANYLGIYIDENLSWHKHIQITINKISKGIGI